MNNNTLFLPLKAKWYDMIESGIKTEDYREFKEYWFKRLANKKYKYVRFSYISILMQNWKRRIKFFTR